MKRLIEGGDVTLVKYDDTKFKKQRFARMDDQLKIKKEKYKHFEVAHVKNAYKSYPLTSLNIYNGCLVFTEKFSV